MSRIALACLMFLAAMLPAQQRVVRQPANARLEQGFSDSTIAANETRRWLIWDLAATPLSVVAVAASLRFY